MEAIKTALRAAASLLRKAADRVDALAGPKPVRPR